MDYELIIKTDSAGRPYVGGHTGPLPPDATITVKGSEAEEADPWAHLIVMNDVVIDTGAVTGTRIRQHAAAR